MDSPVRSGVNDCGPHRPLIALSFHYPTQIKVRGRRHAPCTRLSRLQALLKRRRSCRHSRPKQRMPATSLLGRAMAQAVSRQSLTAEAWVRSRVSPCGICGGQSSTGTGFPTSTSVFPCQFHSTGAPLHGTTKKTLITFITWLHSKPQGCGASVASSAGPFTIK
jgi:hypothetical protein